jgi:hypothetical protein
MPAKWPDRRHRCQKSQSQCVVADIQIIGREPHAPADILDACSKACSRSQCKPLSGDSHLTVTVILFEMIGGLNG